MAEKKSFKKMFWPASAMPKKEKQKEKLQEKSTTFSYNEEPKIWVRKD